MTKVRSKFHKLRKKLVVVSIFLAQIEMKTLFFETIFFTDFAERPKEAPARSCKKMVLRKRL